MVWRKQVMAGACAALIGGAGVAEATVIGAGTVDVLADIVVTDLAVSVDPDGTGPLASQTFAPGVTAALRFDYMFDLPGRVSDYDIDLRLTASELSAVFDSPFPTDPDVSLVPLLDRGAPPVALFDAAFFPTAVPVGGLADLPLASFVLGLLGADAGSFIVDQPATGLVPAGLLSGRYAFDPGSTAEAGSGTVDLFFDADGVFEAIREPFIAALPEDVARSLAEAGLVDTGLFNGFQGVQGRVALDIDVVALAPVPLPAGMYLLPIALGGLVLLGRWRRRTR